MKLKTNVTLKMVTVMFNKLLYSSENKSERLHMLSYTNFLVGAYIMSLSAWIE